MYFNKYNKVCENIVRKFWKGRRGGRWSMESKSNQINLNNRYIFFNSFYYVKQI